MLHLSPGYQCDIGLFQVKFNLELTRQVVTCVSVSSFTTMDMERDITVPMVVYQTSSVDIELFLHVNTFLFFQ